MSSTSPQISNTTVSLFTGKNYRPWAFKMQCRLKREHLWEIATGKLKEADYKVKVEADGKKAAPTWAEMDQEAYGIICGAIHDDFIYNVELAETAEDAWNALKKAFEGSEKADIRFLRQEFANMRMDNDEDPVKYATRVMTLGRQITSCDPKNVITDEQLSQAILNGLPGAYNSLVQAIESKDDFTAEYVVKRIRIEHMRKTARKETQKKEKEKEKEKTPKSERGLAAEHTTRKETRECFHCNKPGHLVKDCRTKKAELKKEAEKKKTDEKSESNSVEEKTKKKKKKAADTEISLSAYAYEPEPEDPGLAGITAFYATAVEVLEVNVTTTQRMKSFIVDSGATCHMSGNRSQFKNLRPLEKQINVQLGDLTDLKAEGRGDVPITLGGKAATIKDVLYVPKLRKNLMSITQAMKQGIECHFREGKLCILMNGTKITEARRVGSLFYIHDQRDERTEANSTSKAADSEDDTDEDTDKEEINQVAISKPTDQSELWHNRLGHIGWSTLQTIAKRENLELGTVTGRTCVPCIEGKQTRSKYTKDARPHTLEYCDEVSSDVAGPLRIGDGKGHRYWATFNTRGPEGTFTVVYLMRKKNEVEGCYLNYEAYIERQTGRKVKRVITDGGSEYMALKSHFLKKGIDHVTTARHSPSDNGEAERMNRTLFESARSMLIAAKLPPSFWGHAIKLAAHIYNRTQTARRSPWEAVTGRKPRITHMKVFGCTAYVHTPDKVRKKQDPKSRECTFVGYEPGDRNYLLLDATGAEVVSRDVIFDETKFHGTFDWTKRMNPITSTEDAALETDDTSSSSDSDDESSDESDDEEEGGMQSTPSPIRRPLPYVEIQTRPRKQVAPIEELLSSESETGDSEEDSEDSDSDSDDSDDDNDIEGIEGADDIFDEVENFLREFPEREKEMRQHFEEHPEEADELRRQGQEIRYPPP